jgi:excisionase family DNA binding protein
MRLGAEGIENKKVEGVNFEVGNSLIFENRIASKWLTTKEASFVLGVSENALRIMVHREQITAFKFGRRLRFRLSDCEALFTTKGAM